MTHDACNHEIKRLENELARLRAELHRADIALSESPSHGQEELAEASLADGIRNYRNAVEAELARLRAEVEILVWNLAGISTMACSRTPTDYNREMARPALNEVAELVKDYDRIRAVNAELRKILARALAEEKCGADGVFFTVATECTEGRCWHFQARAALSRAEVAWKAERNEK